MNIWDTLVKFFQGGGDFMFPIAVVLVIGLSIAVERYIYLFRVSTRNRQLWNQIVPMLSQGNFRQVVQVTSKSESAIGHILNYGLARISTARRRDDIEKAILKAGFGSNGEVVAELVAIGDADKVRFLMEGRLVSAAGRDLEAKRIGAGIEEISHRYPDIGLQSPFGLLRELLGQYLSTPPDKVQFHYAERGKPALAQTDPTPTAGDPPVHFNVSHTRSLALLAFSSDRHLGVDVEFIRPMENWADIARRFFSQNELAELRALPPEQRDEGFYTCWTRKESYIKARGEGLHLPLDSFDVTLTPGLPERLTAEDASNWTLVSLYPREGYAAALTAEGQNLNLQLFDYVYTSTQAGASFQP